MDGKEIIAVLLRCKVKLAKYHEATGGKYHGGQPLQYLNEDIDKAVAALTEEAK